MNKKEFLDKHKLFEKDWKNLVRFEEVRKSGVYNMYDWLGLMSLHNMNGGKFLATWIMLGNNYNEFLYVLDKENKK